LRSGLKAALLSERLEGKEPSEVVKLDPELSELDSLATMLAAVSSFEPLPSSEARERMKDRVMEAQRRVMEGERKREREPARRISVSEPQRLSYATLAVAAVIAAILVVSSVLFTAPGKVAVPPTLGLAEEEAWVFATGMVEVREPGGEWSGEDTPLVVAEGSALRTPPDVRAEIAFGGENLARLDYGSEADILAVNEQGISVRMQAGDGYFRAEKGIPMRVFGGGLEVETAGTVFDLDLGAEDTELLALQNDVQAGVFRGQDEPVRLAQGKMLDLPEQLGEGGLAAQVSDIPPERLQDEWLLWNRTIDGSRGLDTGVMAGVEAQAAQAPGIAQLEAQAPEDNGDNGEDGQNGDAVKPAISLQGAVQQGGVALAWDVKDGTASEFVILRATGREPAFPQDELARVGGGTRGYTDREAKAGMSYTYRVACPHGDGMIYSNAVVVAIPQVKPTITLSGRAVDGGKGMPVIDLDWHVEGELQPDFYALVRAEMNQPPVFPPSGSMLEWRRYPPGPDFYVRDEDLYMGYTYNYRVFAIKGGSIILESNMVSIYVDTTVIMQPPR
jgi:ferric-dicitrate binding protein FerR (iron transport regulator)